MLFRSVTILGEPVLYKDGIINLEIGLLVVICFTCHVRKARDLRETRICIIDTALENKNHLTTNTAYVSQYSDTRAR